MVDKLSEKELDYLHISLNDYKRLSVLKDYQEKTILAYVHDKIAGRLPLVGVGSVANQEDVKNVLNDAELVAAGQALLHDLNWGQKILKNQPTEDLQALKDNPRHQMADGLFGFVKTFRMDDH